MSQPTSASQPESLPVSQVSVAGPVQLALPSPLIVRMDKKEEQPKRDWLPFLILFLVVSTVLYAVAWARWIHPREHPLPVAAGPKTPGLVVQVSYPRYLAVGDAGEIEVSAINRDTQPLSGTLALRFAPRPGVNVASEDGTVLRFKDLPGGGQVTGRVKIAWHIAPEWLNVGVTAFEVWLHPAGGQPYKVDVAPTTMAISPLPYLDTVLAWLRNTVIVAGLGGLLWEQIKKRLFPSAA